MSSTSWSTLQPTRPWYGRAPWQLASLTASTLARIERSLSDDAWLPTGAIMPQPDGVNDAIITKAKTILSRGKGALSLLETTNQGFGQGIHAAPKKDWQQERFGPVVPEQSINLRDKAHTLPSWTRTASLEATSPIPEARTIEAGAQCSLTLSTHSHVALR